MSAGDGEAVRECLARYGGLVLALARRLLPPGEVEDAVQEVFIELWQQAGRFDPLRAQERTFVTLITRRRCIDRLRRRGAGPRLEPISAAETAAHELDPSRPAEVREESARVRALLGDLSEDQRRVLRLSIHEGLSHSEIAAHTGQPLGTVKTHIRRGLIAVRQLMEAGAPAGSAS